MDPEARHYQDQLHRANQDRMDRLEDKIDELLKTATCVEEATKPLPEMERRIGALESDGNRAKGAMAVLGTIAGLIGAGVGAGVEALIHYMTRK